LISWLFLLAVPCEWFPIAFILAFGALKWCRVRRFYEAVSISLRPVVIVGNDLRQNGAAVFFETQSTAFA
jgi:hypothetical protein